MRFLSFILIISVTSASFAQTDVTAKKLREFLYPKSCGPKRESTQSIKDLSHVMGPDLEGANSVNEEGSQYRLNDPNGQYENQNNGNPLKFKSGNVGGSVKPLKPKKIINLDVSY